MPSVSGPQHRLMELVAHGGTPRGEKGPSAAVAKDFVQADRGHRFGLAKMVKTVKRTDP